MASSSRQNQLRLALEIRRNGSVSSIECDYCLLNSKTCYIMADRLKCSECTRIGRPCVNLSWSSLDKTREEYEAKVEADEKLLAEVVLRLLRNKKILKQANERAKKKALCLANEMREGGEEVDSIDCPAASVGVAFSPAMWSTASMLDDFVATVGAGADDQELAVAASNIAQASVGDAS